MVLKQDCIVSREPSLCWCICTEKAGLMPGEFASGTAGVLEAAPPPQPQAEEMVLNLLSD